MSLTDILLPLVALAFLALLLSKRVRDNTFWQATVTPLASIVGSGFLIVAPLLGAVVGPYTPIAMLGIVLTAFLIGGVIRFNIRHGELIEQSGGVSTVHRWMKQISDLALLGAYIISVAFYLRLMAAFVLRGFGHIDNTAANALTTAILLFIGFVGWRWGLKSLERLEEYSVSVKLAIIAAFLTGLFLFDTSPAVWRDLPHPANLTAVETLRMLAGMLLVVQGFETSRYLGSEYAPDLRIKSMRFAQILSGVIYLGFAILILPLLHSLSGTGVDETQIIDLSYRVSFLLPLMLILAATMSQFSAAIADTIGGGGLMEEQTKGRFSNRQAYLILTLLAIALIWATSIFEIVAYASRAFAFYYLTQTAIAITLVWVRPKSQNKLILLFYFCFLALGLALITLYAIPAD